MNKFAYVTRNYLFKNGDYPSAEEPSAQLQQDGFKPTFINGDGTFSAGDPVEYKHLNFIFNDLYAKAADMASRLDALEGE
ncbi:MAG TPA: hypothetical protein VGL07_17875 [Buttiauxella sp.]